MKRYKIGNFFLCFVPMYCFMVICTNSVYILFFYYVIHNFMEMGDLLEAIVSIPAEMDVTLANVVFQFFASISGYLVYYFAFREKKIESPTKVMSISTFGSIIVLALGAQFVCSFLVTIAVNVFPKLGQNYAKLIEEMGVNGGGILMLISVILLAPLCEEVFFRGMTFRLARKWSLNFWVANIMQAACFGIMHLNIIQGSYAFLLALLIGWVYKETNSLWATIWFHMVFNFGGTILTTLLFGVSDPTEITIRNVVAAALGVAAIFGGIYFIKEDELAKTRAQMFNARLAQGK